MSIERLSLNIILPFDSPLLVFDGAVFTQHAAINAAQPLGRPTPQRRAAVALNGLAVVFELAQLREGGQGALGFGVERKAGKYYLLMPKGVKRIPAHDTEATRADALVAACK